MPEVPCQLRVAAERTEGKVADKSGPPAIIFGLGNAIPGRWWMEDSGRLQIDVSGINSKRKQVQCDAVNSSHSEAIIIVPI